MERKIGETFEFEGKWLKVKEEDAKNACRNCYLVAKECSRYLSIIGECLDKKRSDNKNIVFEDITYKPDKNRQQEEQQQEQAEQPQELNLCEILKDCPIGWKFYSTIFEEVEFIGIEEDRYQIKFEAEDGEIYSVTSNGRHRYEYNGECTLFPSKDQRDWNKWKCPKSKFDPKTLKPFDKVLVRNLRTAKWRCEHFSYFKEGDDHPYMASTSYAFGVPYNEDTKYLIGTTEEAPEYYRYWEE